MKHRPISLAQGIEPIPPPNGGMAEGSPCQPCQPAQSASFESVLRCFRKYQVEGDDVMDWKAGE